MAGEVYDMVAQSSDARFKENVSCIEICVNSVSKQHKKTRTFSVFLFDPLLSRLDQVTQLNSCESSRLNNKKGWRTSVSCIATRLGNFALVVFLSESPELTALTVCLLWNKSFTSALNCIFFGLFYILLVVSHVFCLHRSLAKRRKMRRESLWMRAKSSSWTWPRTWAESAR